MAGYADLAMPRVLSLTPSDESLTGFATAVSGASWTLTATSVPDGLAHQVSIQNNSGNSKAAINITVVGTDANGASQTEVVTGPGASATVETAGYYKTLTSVTPASTWGADTANIGWVDEIATPTLNLNWAAEDIGAVWVDVGGTINFTLQQTPDYPLETTARYFTLPGGGSQTADGVFNTTSGATGFRLLVNSYSSGATLVVNLNQAFISNAPGAGSGGPTTDVNVAEWGGVATTLGQKAMAASVPVVFASDQTPVPVQTPVETANTPAGVALLASTSATLLAANASRIRATIYNPLATVLCIRKAASAATLVAGGYDVAIPPLSTWFSDPYEYSGEIRGICATAGSVNVSESV